MKKLRAALVVVVVVVVAVAVVAVVAIVGAVAFWGWRSQPANSAPARTAVAVGNAPEPSSLTLPVVASLDELQDRLEREIPVVLRELDDDLRGCVPATRLTPAIDCHVTGRITRGPIQVGGRANVFEVTVPVSIRVDVRGRGALGRNIHKRADGSLDVVAAAVLGLAPDWSPSVKVSTDHRWTRPIGVDVLGLRLSFASLVDPTVEQTLRSLERQLPGEVRKLRVQEQARDAWQRAHAVVAVGADPDVWLRFTPAGVAWRGYDIRGRTLSTTVTLSGTAETFVGAAPAARPASSLPPLPPLSSPSLSSPSSPPLSSPSRAASRDGFRFHLPVVIDYPVLEQVAERKLRAHTRQAIEVPGSGTVVVTVRDVRLYQTAPQALAVGVTIDAGVGVAGAGLLDSTGTLWFVATLAVDNAAKQLVVTALEVSAQSRSAPFGLLVSLSRAPALNAMLKEAMAYNFASELDAAVAEANDQLRSRPLPGLRGGLLLQAHVDRVTAGPVIAGPTGVQTSFVAEGQASLSLPSSAASR